MSDNAETISHKAANQIAEHIKATCGDQAYLILHILGETLQSISRQEQCKEMLAGNISVKARWQAKRLAESPPVDDFPGAD